MGTQSALSSVGFPAIKTPRRRNSEAVVDLSWRRHADRESIRHCTGQNKTLLKHHHRAPGDSEDPGGQSKADGENTLIRCQARQCKKV
jgi:hypothetical protein